MQRDCSEKCVHKILLGCNNTVYYDFVLFYSDGVKSAKEPTKHPSTSKMVTEAFTLLKNRKGHTLYAIKKFITDNYNCQISSQINNNIKKYLAEEFEAGRIKMTDSDADKIKFNQRFALSK